MIVYRELSSLVRDLGIPAGTLYAVSNTLDRHYIRRQLPKSSGGVRELSVPDPLLKHIQRQILRVLLVHMPVSPYAMAYRYGGSTLCNAAPHVGKPCVLKLDIRHFFDSILYSAVKETAFPAEVYAENLRILLAMLCYGWDRLPQGAPTSPCITNILMRDFDNEVGAWCRERQIAYTRYCDDMTFSGDFARDEVLRCVEPRLRALGFYLNPGKTKWLPADRRQLVTGIWSTKSAMSRLKSAVHCTRSCISAKNLASPATWREPGSTDRRTATWLSSWAGSTTSCRSRREGGSCRKPGTG